MEPIAMTTSEQQWFTLLLILAITTAILVADWSIWSTIGIQATFSHAFDALYRRWPVTTAVFFLWIGVLVGHLIPTNVAPQAQQIHAIDVKELDRPSPAEQQITLVEPSSSTPAITPVNH